MSGDSLARRDLETAIRSLVPSRDDLKVPSLSQGPATALAGVGGLLTGYVWGWLRGRRSRKRHHP